MNTNPLAKYFRKPGIYIKLPTGGKFNPEWGTTLLEEVGVLPMTAVDEITMKNPDELLNGEALINIAKSCCPDIPNPRTMCNIDMEALYLAIQYATYGRELTHAHKCAKCEEVSDFNIDINYILNKFPDIEHVAPVEFDEVKIHIRPPSVEAITRLALIDVEQKRIVQHIQNSVANEDDEETDEAELARRFYGSFRKIAEHNVDLLANTISYIETPEGNVNDYDSIMEFLSNIPTKVVDEIDKKVKELSKKPKDATTFEFVCPECEHKGEVALEVNPVNFFTAG